MNRTQAEIEAYLKAWAKPIVEAHRPGFYLSGIDFLFGGRNFFIVVGLTGVDSTERIPVSWAMADDAMGSFGDHHLREHVNAKLFQCFSVGKP